MAWGASFYDCGDKSLFYDSIRQLWHARFCPERSFVSKRSIEFWLRQGTGGGPACEDGHELCERRVAFKDATRQHAGHDVARQHHGAVLPLSNFTQPA